ncbi:hypothetical protein [Demequina iriomotensis]|uniref:hypothetical protein n=1 Tax=Demequina iriomotensis TaxID=1536641 RepID=UPI0007839F3B|nr:hypothetical protein [Demequina iriomotensis]
MPGLLRRGYYRTRSLLGRHVVPRAPWLRRLDPRPPRPVAPAPKAAPVAAPAPKPARFSALNLDRLRRAGGEYPGSLPVTSHAEDLAALVGGRSDVAHFEDRIGTVPPPEGLVFAGVCNDKYVPGLEALILSLVRVYPGMSNRFVIFHDDGLSDFARARLLGIYPHFDFERRDPGVYDVAMGTGYNHARVGLLGYLTLEVLTMEEPEWIVVLDTDLLVLGDISALWSGTRIKAVADVGHRPYAIASAETGRLVINSGVLSFPRSERGPEAAARMAEVLARVNDVTDPALFRYADQKFWNIYLGGRDVEMLPQTYNTNKILLCRDYPDEIGSIRILHLTGPKPWYSFSDDTLLTEQDRKWRPKARAEFATAFALWNQAYRSTIVQSRTQRFLAEEGTALRALEGRCAGRPAVLIGNGPSLNDTDMSAFAGYEKIAFNWFVNHPDFDTIAPDHLVLPSHMLFGSWHTMTPALPEAFLTALTRHEHRPTLWFSFYFKDYIETLEELRGYEVRYFLFEKPFKRRIAHTGWAPLDLYAPLVDSNTGVLTAGVPMALHMGASRIVLVGCDSNYASASGSYFYAGSEHASNTTREDTLVATWEDGGEGPFGYQVVKALLDERGVELRDATVRPNLPMLEPLSLEDARLG